MVGGKNFTTNFDGGYSPTDGTNTPQGGAAVSAAPTKLLLTPQNARNTRNLLLRETPTDGTDWYRWLGCAEMNNGLRMWLSVAEVSGLRITKSAFVRFGRFVFEKNA